MKRLRGNQSFLLKILGIFVAVQLLAAFGLYFLGSQNPWPKPWIWVFSFFVLALFLTERYRLYYINTILYLVAIVYLVVHLTRIVFNRNCGIWGVFGIIGEVAIIAILIIFVRYPIKIIRFGMRSKTKI